MMPGRTLRLLDRIRQGATDEVATFAGERCTAWARRHARPRSISADHPATQRVKRKALGVPDGAAEGRAGENLRSLSGDFTQKSADGALAHYPGSEGRARTRRITDGFLRYV